MFFRAPGLASGATASSRSRNTWSTGSPWALSSIFGFEPGTARQERRAGAAGPPGPPPRSVGYLRGREPAAVTQAVSDLPAGGTGAGAGVGAAAGGEVAPRGGPG